MLPAALVFADGLREAISAFRDGYHNAAHALATNILDTVLTHYSRPALRVAPASAANQSYRSTPRKGNWRARLCPYPLPTLRSGRYSPDHPPQGLRRNATAHAFGRNHYTMADVVVAVMAATSLLCCFVRDTAAFDEQAVRMRVAGR